MINMIRVSVLANMQRFAGEENEVKKFSGESGDAESER